MNHSVNVSQQATGVSTPSVAESGLPFVIGIAPVQAAEHPAAVGAPVLCTSWNEAVDLLGYSEDWTKYTLCEFMYSHFVNFAQQPVVFVNLLNPATMKTSETNQSVSVSNHKAVVTGDAIASTVVVKLSASGEALTEDEDYSVYYSGGSLYVELLSGGSAYSATTVILAYDKIVTTAITAALIAQTVEKVDLCITKLGIIPDLLCAPGFSHETVVAAALAAKAASISGLCTAKALIDIDASTVNTYQAAVTAKGTNGFTASEEIVCWPMAKLGNYIFHMSTIAAGRMAATDTDNGGNPYESPSNKQIPVDSLCLADGTEVELTLAQANVLNNAGIVTGLNFMNGWVLWGNYTGCYPASTDVKDYFIPVSRMFGWVGNTLVKTFWSKLDAPMNRRLVDNILDTCNIWLNGLVGQGYLLGARVEMIDAENPITNLMAGIIKLHVYITPPSPMQELDFVLEYDASYVEAAFQ